MLCVEEMFNLKSLGGTDGINFFSNTKMAEL